MVFTGQKEHEKKFSGVRYNTCLWDVIEEKYLVAQDWIKSKLYQSSTSAKVYSDLIPLGTGFTLSSSRNLLENQIKLQQPMTDFPFEWMIKYKVTIQRSNCLRNTILQWMHFVENVLLCFFDCCVSDSEEKINLKRRCYKS